MKSDSVFMDKLPIMEQFYSLQGEGYFSGIPAYFIRTAGCDVGCVWCDVKDSWNADDHPVIPVIELVKAAVESGSRHVIVTGGEPAMYDLSTLCDALHHAGLKVHLETSGSHPIRGNFDWITLSPKKFKPPLPESYHLSNELKIVVFNRSDFDWAETYATEMLPETHLYLQPEWEKQEEMHPLIIQYVKAYPQWRVSLQTHKYLNIQ